MEVLVARLSQLDSQAAGAMRVVMFYDTLMRRRVDLAALARASATLAECVVGIRLHASGKAIRMAPDGTEVPTTEPTPAASVAITLDEEEIGTVWLARSGQPWPLDELLLERLAIAAAAVVERYGPARTTMADPALVELAVSPDTDAAARARALRLLGFAADRPLQAVAVAVAARSEHPLDRLAALLCPGHPVKAAPLADVAVVLATSVDPSRLPADVRAGVGGPDSPDRSWRQARAALRFTTTQRPVVRHDDLGALALLAQVPADALRDNADVAAIARLADTPEDLRTLEVYSTAGSLRRAAELLHLHHSSVARRLEHVGATLGIDLTQPGALTRAELALTAWRLLHQ